MKKPPGEDDPPKAVHVSVDWSGKVTVTVGDEVVDAGDFMATIHAASRKAMGEEPDA